jgi:hypothetical protein
MTQLIPFVSSNYAAPNFQVTLDGATYNIVITWNVSAQRFYVNVYDSNGNLICAVPLTESPPDITISDMYWDQNRQVVVVNSPTYICRPYGQIVRYTISNCYPDVFNGTFNCLMESLHVFSYQMVNDPGQIVTIGSAGVHFNMLEPWFNSSFIYRKKRFEVNP